MKRGDIFWGLLLAVMILLFVIPTTGKVILEFSEPHPYIAGFIKFAILATMGDVLGKRIVTGEYTLSIQVLFRALVWGTIGCMVTLVFPIFMGGAGLAQAGGLLPFFEVAFAQAFFGSTVMNLTFAPAMNTFHRLMDLWIEKFHDPQVKKVTLRGLVQEVDWPQFVTFNWLKVGIFFWIPVHTIVFLLPEELRVIVAAFSSIALGIILSFAAKSSQQKLVEK